MIMMEQEALLRVSIHNRTVLVRSHTDNNRQHTLSHNQPVSQSDSWSIGLVYKRTVSETVDICVYGQISAHSVYMMVVRLGNIDNQYCAAGYGC